MSKVNMNSRMRSYSRILTLVSGLTLAVGGFEFAAYGQYQTSDWPTHLEGTSPRALSENMLVEQHKQFEQFLLGRIAATASQRDRLWQPILSDSERREELLREMRQRLRAMLGLLDESKEMKAVGRLVLADGEVRVEDVEIPIEREFQTRSLVLFPERSSPAAAVVAVPPEHLTREQFLGLGPDMTPAPWLLSLLSRGAVVAVPVGVERTFDHDLSELSRGAKMTRRQLLHRLGFVVGRTVVGLDVDQVLALRRFLSSLPEVDPTRIGVMGVEQGGMTALYSAAVEETFSMAVVVDYFGRREECWQEPVDRMIYGQLLSFGDAEVAALIAPRRLNIIYRPGSPRSEDGVHSESGRAQRFYESQRALQNFKQLHSSTPLADGIQQIATALGLDQESTAPRLAYRASEAYIQKVRNAHFDRLKSYLNRLIDKSSFVRDSYWNLNQTPPEQRSIRSEALRSELRQLMGEVRSEPAPLNPRTRLIEDNESFVGYDVVIDVVAGLEVWGHLLIPKGLESPARAVIAQHGGGGRPGLITGIGEEGDSAYHRFGAHLAHQGFVVFAPMVAVGNRPFPEARDRNHQVVLAIQEAINPKVRMAAALGMMRTGIEQAKLAAIIDFLETLPFVAADKVGYYGLSYGGYSAIWMTPLESRLKATVISGHFNDWQPKITSPRIATSYLRHPDEDFSNWNVLHRFTHHELIAAAWPRAICIEYGERDAVTPPGWQRRAWEKLQGFTRAWESSDRIVLDLFDGVHEIHFTGALDFLNRHLRPGQPAGRDYDIPGRARVGEPVRHRIDSSFASIVRGTFYVTEKAPVLRGIKFRLSRVGNPGDLLVRLGETPGGSQIGEVRVDSASVSVQEESWTQVNVVPVRLDPSKTYYFQIAAEWGWEDRGDYYVAFAPRDLGGKRFLPDFAIAFQVQDGGR